MISIYYISTLICPSLSIQFSCTNEKIGAGLENIAFHSIRDGLAEFHGSWFS